MTLWTRSVSLVKIAYFSGFKHSSKHLENTILVFFEYFNKKIVYIVPFKLNSNQYFSRCVGVYFEVMTS